MLVIQQKNIFFCLLIIQNLGAFAPDLTRARNSKAVADCLEKVTQVYDKLNKPLLEGLKDPLEFVRNVSRYYDTQPQQLNLRKSWAFLTHKKSDLAWPIVSVLYDLDTEAKKLKTILQEVNATEPALESLDERNYKHFIAVYHQIASDLHVIEAATVMIKNPNLFGGLTDQLLLDAPLTSFICAAQRKQLELFLNTIHTGVCSINYLEQHTNTKKRTSLLHLLCTIPLDPEIFKTIAATLSEEYGFFINTHNANDETPLDFLTKLNPKPAFADDYKKTLISLGAEHAVQKKPVVKKERQAARNVHFDAKEKDDSKNNPYKLSKPKKESASYGL